MEGELIRRYSTSPVRRAEEEGMVEGIAAVVNSITDLGYFREMIAPGAFDDVLKDDVRALLNHDRNYVLARTKAGTLELSLNDKGDLVYKYQTPNISYALDLAENIRLGNINQSSFAFYISDEEWKDLDSDNPLRVIKKLSRLVDVSPVTFPAYPDTSVSAREKLQDTVKRAREGFMQVLNPNEDMTVDMKAAGTATSHSATITTTSGDKTEIREENNKGKQRPLNIYKRKLSLLKLRK